MRALRPRERPRVAGRRARVRTPISGLRSRALDGDARNGVLAGRIDVGEQHLVGERQRRTEVLQQVLRCASSDAAGRRRRCGGRRWRAPPQHRRDLGRVMAVVVDDDAAVCLALALETAFGAAKLRQRGGDRRKRDAEVAAAAITASALSTLWRPGTWSVSTPSAVSRPSAPRRATVAFDPKPASVMSVAPIVACRLSMP